MEAISVSNHGSSISDSLPRLTPTTISRPRKLSNSKTTTESARRESLRGMSTGVHKSVASTLPSPSRLAARSYYSERKASMGVASALLQPLGSSVAYQVIPRRHSTMPLTDTIRGQANVEDNPSILLRLTTQTSNLSLKPCEIEKGQSELSPTIQGDMEKAAVVRRQSEHAVQCRLIKEIPFQYTHDRLRAWGHAYLGNTMTVDAFVNAVNLRRTSLINIQGVLASGDLVTVRARVIPKDKHRKPFLIHRKFDIDNLRQSIPAVKLSPDITSAGLSPVRRSSRIRRLSTQATPTPSHRRGRADSSHQQRLGSLKPGAVPIHIEYALHYLPVLGALLLSGFVRKGDSIDLPVPAPEAWHDTVSYIYTGNGPLSFGMRDNIMFLAGRAPMG